MSHRIFFSITALVVCLPMTVGCEQKRAQRADRGAVKGSVTFNSAPILGGTVTFHSVSDPNLNSMGIILKDGTYMVEDAPLGETKVSVETDSMLQGAPDRHVKIPSKFNNPNSSGLTTTVAGGENTFDIELK